MKITATWFINDDDDKEEPITIETPLGLIEIRPCWNLQFGETIVVTVVPSEGMALKKGHDEESILYTL